MSCWVAPVVAAELWNMQLSDLLEAIQRGEIATRTELGFTVVELDYGSSAAPVPATAPHASDIHEWDDLEAEPVAVVASRAARAMLSVPPADSSRTTLADADWRIIRPQVSRTRRPPRRMAMAA